jgi:hypothetical protein
MRVVTVLKAGLLASILDITATGVLTIIVLRRTTPTRLLQSIASGLLGPAAFKGGLPTAGLGALFHFTIAMSWATVFAIGASHLPALGRIRTTRSAIAVGVVYGALVWLVMDFVVLAGSRARSVPVSAAGFWIQLGIHMLCVGLPIAVIVLRRR